MSRISGFNYTLYYDKQDFQSLRETKLVIESSIVLIGYVIIVKPYCARDYECHLVSVGFFNMLRDLATVVWIQRKSVFIYNIGRKLLTRRWRVTAKALWQVSWKTSLFRSSAYEPFWRKLTPQSVSNIEEEAKRFDSQKRISWRSVKTRCSRPTISPLLLHVPRVLKPLWPKIVLLGTRSFLEIFSLDIPTRNMPTTRKRIFFLSFLSPECSSEVLIFFILLTFTISKQFVLCRFFEEWPSSRQPRDNLGMRCGVIGLSRLKRRPHAQKQALVCLSKCARTFADFARGCQLLISSIVFGVTRKSWE